MDLKTLCHIWGRQWSHRRPGSGIHRADTSALCAPRHSPGLIEEPRTPCSPPHTTTPSRGTLGKRLLTTFCVVLTLTLLGSVIGIWSLRQIQQSTETMVSQGVATERLVADAYRYQAINSERFKAIALSSEPEVNEILGADIAATQQRYDGLIAELDKGLQAAEDRALLEGIQAAGKDFQKARAELMAASESNLPSASARYMQSGSCPLPVHCCPHWAR